MRQAHRGGPAGTVVGFGNSTAFEMQRGGLLGGNHHGHSDGAVAIGDSQLEDHYAVAGLTLTVPLYAGGVYAAKQQEAELRAQAAAQSVRELEDNVVRDVRIAWLNAQNAFDRLQIARKLLANARLSFELAQARYKEGISSVVELNQAELNELSAEISYANTQYEYLLQRSALSYQTGALR